MEILNDQYCIQGVPMLPLCETYGSPLYVYDSQKMTEQYERLTGAFDIDHLQINFACKALTNINVLRHFMKLGAGLDAVSIQEIKLGLHVGFPANKILYTPNCVGFQEINDAIALGVNINVDNIEMLEQVGIAFPKVPLCVRVNPHVMAGGHSKISVGHIDSKFGISIYQMPLVHRLVETLGLKINGIHMHTGSDILDIDVFLKAADILFDTAAKFKDLEYIDFGSGFKVQYKLGDISTDIEEFGESMSAKFKNFCKSYGRDLILKFEPGKYLVSEAGYFLVTTNVIKQTTSTVFAGVDSGFNHLIRPMFYNSHHDIVNISNPNGKKKIYTVVGYICETDTFGINRQINEIKPEDILVFKNAGAYCFSMASNYNSRYRPAEVLIQDGKAHLIREREVFDDLLKGQVEIGSL